MELSLFYRPKSGLKKVAHGNPNDRKKTMKTQTKIMGYCKVGCRPYGSNRRSPSEEHVVTLYIS